MDLDAFAAVHQEAWDRLDRLSARRPRSLRGAEVDELVILYQQAATHLSVVRSSTSDPVLAARLSRTVARGRAAVTGVGEPPGRELARFVVVSFPAAVWRARWWVAGSAAASLAVATALALWVVGSPELTARVLSDPSAQQVADQDFRRYYSTYAAPSFASQVWTNNASIAALCVALGVTGVGVVYVLAQNALNIGTTAGVMAVYHRLDVFFAFITPHGLLELTAVFTAAGSGLALFWAWVEPGPRTRAQALAVEGRSMVTVALGLVPVLAVSGVVEAFVTPAPWPTWARIAVGATVWLAFLGYVGVLGRRAAAAGETGDLRAELVEDDVPVSG